MKKLYILLVVSTLFLVTCKKIPELKIYNLEISEELVITTSCDATITAKYSFPTEIYDIKVLVNTSEDMNNATLVDATIANNVLNATVSNLVPSTNYYYCFRYSNGINLVDTDTKTFKTQDISIPSVTTKDVADITLNTAISGGHVTSDGGIAVTARGVCWSNEHNPTISNSHTLEGDGTGEFLSSLTGLTLNTLYYVRAYAVNAVGVAYGNEISFTTLSEPIVPSVNTIQVTNITPTSARIEGNVTSSGGADVTERGVCWGTSQNPTISGNHSSSGSGTGSFVVDITGLIENTMYYARTYAKNSVGTAYGEAISFTTTSNPTVPTVTTNNVSNITTTTATCGGNVTSAGNGTVSARGVCWSTSSNPTISNSHTTNGSGTGTFTSSLTGLTPNTTYYVRAYATNEAGTAYGTQKTFTTNADATIPTVTTNNVTDITTTTATCGGNVTSAGNGTVSARGVCWSTSQNPTITDAHTTNSTGTGTFTSFLTGLTPNTTYYVRAYATNEAGTAYGSQKTFTTNSEQPQAPTGAINGLFSVSATQQVWFSQGNLQYKASTNTWKFAEHQYDYIGSGNSNISSTYSGWIDLFGWGTSGWYNGNTYYMPYDTADDYSSDSQYGPPGEHDLTGDYANADWGVYNPINNGGNVAGQWRTLTNSEWVYVLFTRTTPSGIRFAKAIVNDVNGVIVLPDDWEGSIYVLNSINNRTANYNSNIISASNWTTILQNHGAVFLPATGSRVGTGIYYAGTNAYYWSSSCHYSYQALSEFFSDTQLKTGEWDGRHNGNAVRLIQDY
jgi:hypothetical protein